MIEPLGHLCDFVSGGTPSRSNLEYFSGDIPWITGADLNGSAVISARSFITDAATRESATNRVPPGTVLLVTRTSVGKVAVADRELCFSQDITALIPDPRKLDTGYLVQFLRANESYFDRLARGATIRGVPRSVIADLQIPLPPLPEQRRIAAILDQADALRAKRREAIAQLDKLAQSIFLELFGDPVNNPLGWPMLRLQDALAIPLRNGLSPSHSGGVQAKVLTLSAVTGSEFDASAWKTSTFQSPPRRDQAVDKDDFLVCRGNGNVRLVGKGYFPTDSMPDVTFPDTMIAARVAPSRVEPAFLQRVWNSAAVRRQVESLARTTNGTFKVNQTMLEGITFIQPPPSLQREFARRVAAIEALKSAHRTSLDQLEALFASLQHRAFRGEL